MKSWIKQRLLSLTEAARYLGISKRTLERMIDRGDLLYVKVASMRKIKIDDLERYIEKQEGK